MWNLFIITRFLIINGFGVDLHLSVLFVGGKYATLSC